MFESSIREVQVNEPSARAKQRAASRESALAGIAITYPDRRISVPKGLTLLEKPVRAFKLDKELIA